MHIIAASIDLIMPAATALILRFAPRDCLPVQHWLHRTMAGDDFIVIGDDFEAQDGHDVQDVCEVVSMVDVMIHIYMIHTYICIYMYIYDNIYI